MTGDRTAAADLSRLLEDCDAPIYVLDEDRRIVFCNAACARWLGVSAETLFGRQTSYHAPSTDDSPDATAAGLCPPPAVFSGKALSATVSSLRPDGKLVWRRSRFLPLAGGQNESAEVLAVLDTVDCSEADRDATAGEDARLHDELRRLRSSRDARFGPQTLLGSSPAMMRARAQVELASQSRACVLITGPRGSGKDHVAKAIHYSSHASALVPLDCGLLDTNQIRATLRATWTKYSGAKDIAATVLLTDVDAAAPEAQGELVELLSSPARSLSVVATTCHPLSALAAEGRLSRDLICKLSTITIELPPLVERLEDLPILAQGLVEEVNAGGDKQVGGFTSEALDRLADYSWPANIDELALVVRRAQEAAAGGEIRPHDLPELIQWEADAAAHPRRHDEVIVMEEFLARVEIELITRALRRVKGNKSKAARLLGMTRPRLYRRLVQLGLEKPRDKEAEPSG